MSEKQYIERYWRDATPADAIKEPPMVARFRNSEEHVWVIGPLMGIRRDNFYQWYSTNLGSHEECQVYDAPDPGEGWRLIDTENEQPQDGDEIYDASVGLWTRRIAPFTSNVLSINRRRIAPTVTYVPFTWEDRDQLRGRIITFVYQNSTIEFRCESFSVYDDEFLVNDFCAKWLCKNAVFVDTKEPVGKKVAQ